MDGCDLESRNGVKISAGQCETAKKAIVYYLFLASPKAVAEKIINDIFKKYR